MTDWALGTYGTLSYTLELYGDQTFTVNDSGLLDQTWLAHRVALLEIIRTAELGSGGIVIDGSGKAISGAEINLLDISSTESKSFTPQTYPELKALSDAEGMFRLLTGARTYSLSIEKTGYQPFTKELTLDGNGKTSIESTGPEFFQKYILTEEP